MGVGKLLSSLNSVDLSGSLDNLIVHLTTENGDFLLFEVTSVLLIDQHQVKVVTSRELHVDYCDAEVNFRMSISVQFSW